VFGSAVVSSDTDAVDNETVEISVVVLSPSVVVVIIVVFVVLVIVVVELESGTTGKPVFESVIF